MPLPSQKYGARQCSAKSKRSGVRCLNNAVSGATICRMHGHVPKTKVNRGKDHGMFKHGDRSKEGIKQHSEKLSELRYLEDLGHAIGLMKGPKTRGRKPNEYIDLNYRPNKT